MSSLGNPGSHQCRAEDATCRRCCRRRTCRVSTSNHSVGPTVSESSFARDSTGTQIRIGHPFVHLLPTSCSESSASASAAPRRRCPLASAGIRCCEERRSPYCPCGTPGDKLQQRSSFDVRESDSLARCETELRQSVAMPLRHDIYLTARRRGRDEPLLQ